MNKTFNVKYGVDTYPCTKPENATFGDIKQDGSLKHILGFGDNVRALVNGVEQSDSTQVPDGCTVVLETKANTKAN